MITFAQTLSNERVYSENLAALSLGRGNRKELVVGRLVAVPAREARRAPSPRLPAPGLFVSVAVIAHHANDPVMFLAIFSLCKRLRGSRSGNEIRGARTATNHETGTHHRRAAIGVVLMAIGEQSYAPSSTPSRASNTPELRTMKEDAPG